MMRRLCLLAAILVIGDASIWAARWAEIDKGLPRIVAGANGLAIDPLAPSTLYSWGYSWGGGALFKSTDGAASWIVVNGVTGVNWVAIDPQESGTLYAGTIHGLAKSADGGATWIGLDTGLSPMSWISPLVIDPQNNTLYAVFISFSAGVTTAGIVRSTDGGASWSTLPWSQARPQSFLTVDPVTPSTLYAVTPINGIFKSTDRGESWISIKARQDAGPAEFVQALAVDPVIPSTIYAGGYLWGPGDSPSAIIFKSTDGGQNWRKVRTVIPAGASVTSLAIDPESPSRVYATYVGGNCVEIGSRQSGSVTTTCSGWGVLKSADAGETWTVMNAGLPFEDVAIGAPLAVDPNNPATLYVGRVERSVTGAGGIFKSTDGAASWNSANKGRSFVDTRVLAVDPVNAGTIYTAAGSEGVFKSVDGGGNWTKLATFQLPREFGFSGDAYVRSLVIDFIRPNTLYAVTARVDGASSGDRVLFKSTDGGVTWSDTVSPLSCCSAPAALVMDPTDSNSLYLGIYNLEVGEESYALLKSTNGGASWRDLDCCNGKALTIDPTNPTTLYAGAPSGLLKSTDGGASWSKTGLNIGVNVLVLDPGNTSVIYSATGAGLFKTTDGGVSWAPINDGLASLIATRSTVTGLVIDPANPQALYAGTSGYGIFRSTDGGAHWSPFNDGLTNFDVRFLALAPGKSDEFYAGTGSGIFVTNFPSETIHLP